MSRDHQELGDWVDVVVEQFAPPRFPPPPQVAPGSTSRSQLGAIFKNATADPQNSNIGAGGASTDLMAVSVNQSSKRGIPTFAATSVGKVDLPSSAISINNNKNAGQKSNSGPPTQLRGAVPQGDVNKKATEKVVVAAGSAVTVVTVSYPATAQPFAHHHHLNITPAVLGLRRVSELISAVPAPEKGTGFLMHKSQCVLEHGLSTAQNQSMNLDTLALQAVNTTREAEEMRQAPYRQADRATGSRSAAFVPYVRRSAASEPTGSVPTVHRAALRAAPPM